MGAFWRTTRPWARGEGPATALDVWVCVLPIIPLHFGWKAAITHG